MPVTRQYQTYYGIYLTHYESSWGGNTYHEVLVKEFPSEYLSSATISSGATDVTFMYPSLYLNKYYIDGVVEGHVSIYNESPSDTYYCREYGVQLLKSDDVPSNESVLGSYTYTLSSSSAILPEDYLTLPVFIPVEHELVEEDERLLFRFYFYTSEATDACGVAHYNDSSIIDMQIKVPYAPEG